MKNIDTIGRGIPTAAETEPTEAQISLEHITPDSNTETNEEIVTAAREKNPADIAGLIAQARAAAEVAVPTEELSPEAEVDALAKEVDELDGEIVAAVQRRAELSQQLADARAALGAPRRTLNEELRTVNRFGELGELGNRIGLAVVNIGRRSLRQPSINPEN